MRWLIVWKFVSRPPSQRLFTYGWPALSATSLTASGELRGEVLRLRQQPLRLQQVDDVDAAPLAVDEAAHLGVPAARLVAEVDSGLQQLLDANLVGHCDAPLVRVARDCTARDVADPVRALGRAPAPGRAVTRPARVGKQSWFDCTQELPRSCVGGSTAPPLPYLRG